MRFWRWWRRADPEWSDLANWSDDDLTYVRANLDRERAGLRSLLITLIAEQDRRRPTRADPGGRRSSSVRVIMEPAIVETEADPHG